ncbi:DNA mismatch repair protein MutS [Halodesulfurarchaeum formicicum]|uniref:DNA-binding protein MutS2 n=2 Tax=Halodesulfurarchaeum formicicum TaxID=1873524 RepID=A0A1D8S721_9EURY|nr:DNA mismatch repair protein MutS [Halodesulfurarchaeum formicicum]
MDSMELEAIPGIGPKTREALATLEDPVEALERGDVAAIAAVPGISQGRAVRIVRNAIRHRHDDPGGFLATDRAEAVYDGLRSLLAERAVTDYGRKRIETFYPSAVPARIAETRAVAERAMTREFGEPVREALTGLEPLSEPGAVRVRDRCLATTDAETYSRATEAVPELSVELVSDARALADLARGYATVIALDREFTGVEVDGDVRVEPDALENPAELVPERVLAFYGANRESIQAAIEVHRVANLECELDLDALAGSLSRIEDDGQVSSDAELTRLAAAVDDLEEAVSTAESIANDRLTEAISETDVTVDGADLLSLAERGAGVDSILARELTQEFDGAIEAARNHLVEALDLQDEEATAAARVFPEEPTFPVERNESALSRLEETLTTARDRRAGQVKRELAEELAGAREPVRGLVRRALELDVEQAISRFAADFDCVMADRSGRGFEIEGGRSPLLAEPPEAVEPVDYAVEDVALLSGVNSGGKTTTLDMIAAITILAHMGLPVPATAARVPEIEEIHYHAKSSGTLDAGALETTLRDFASLSAGGATKLVLVDELESITEPGASAKIIAGIIEALQESEATAVIVSHLAAGVREACETPVTVDGIRALGLENGELQVKRSPEKDHLARSTPELIVEKLAEGDTEGRTEAFYRALLEKF